MDGIEVEDENTEHDTSLTNRLIFLDPHVVTPHVNPSEYAQQKNHFHCMDQARSIHMDQLDPCISFGFLLKSKEDFNQFTKDIE